MTEMVWAILRQNNRILLTQRSGNIWTLPGEKINPKNMNAITTICQELKENVGINGKRFRELLHTQIDEYNIQIFFCDKWLGKPKLRCKNITGMGWFTWGEIYALDQNLTPLISNILLHLSYLMQHYDHHPNEWHEQWREVK